MDVEDVTIENFFKKFSYSSDPDPGNKIVMSNGAFAQCIINLKLNSAIERLRQTLTK